MLAVAGPGAAVRQDNGVVAVDAQRLSTSYRGRTLALAEIEDLNDDARATISVTDRELACHDVSLYVDTQAEADRYADGHEAR